MKKLITSILFILASVASALASEARDICKAWIRHYEGLRLEAYRCPAGHWTIGYGHTLNVHEGMKINREQAEIFLDKDLDYALACVKRNVKVPINENQLYALADFTFNCGEQNLKLLINYSKNSDPDIPRLNNGNYESIRTVMPLFCRVGRTKYKALEERRNEEVKLFYHVTYVK